jgi:hypothetical protein
MKVLHLILIPSCVFVLTSCRTNPVAKVDPSVLAEDTPFIEASCDKSTAGCAPNEELKPCLDCEKPRELATTPSTQGDCRVDGYVLRNRQSFSSIEGCNRCSCRDGEFSCTRLACEDQPRPKGCRVGPFVLPFGKIIALADGCNSCRCESEAKMSCTAHDCSKLDSNLSK